MHLHGLECGEAAHSEQPGQAVQNRLRALGCDDVFRSYVVHKQIIYTCLTELSGSVAWLNQVCLVQCLGLLHCIMACRL